MKLFLADKPAGLTTHTSLNPRERDSALVDPNDGFKEHLEARLGLDLSVVHRLDRDTTGAILFARSQEAAVLISDLFKNQSIYKSYLFLTDRLPSAMNLPEHPPAGSNPTGGNLIKHNPVEHKLIKQTLSCPNLLGPEPSDQIKAHQTKSLHGNPHLIVESRIERQGSDFVSEPGTPERPNNARTVFTPLAASHGLTLWRAEPASGKPHQIRLHAAELGIPILGDPEHGGSNFPALCLHSQEIRFSLGDANVHHTAPPPIWFHQRHLTADHRLIGWLAAIDRRLRLLSSYGASSRESYGASSSESYGASSSESANDPHLTIRWIHTEGDPLRVEQLGPVIWLSWYADDSPSPSEWQSIQTLLQIQGWQSWYLQLRGDRGRTPNQEEIRLSHTPPPLQWIAKENDLSFEFRRDSGLSPGLFLDQRRNRKWIMAHSRDARVLNLFCYTGGFSVAAAAGGARQVVSVDVSRGFLERTKKNFALNDLTTEGHEFRAMDAREYLLWANRKNLSFDLIICDPPSFGRSKAGPFRIEKDFESLIHLLARITAPGGRILFSTNFEGWSLDEFASRAKRALSSLKFAGPVGGLLAGPATGRAQKDPARDAQQPAQGYRLHLEATPSPDLDFELPRRPRNLKTAFFVRESHN